MSITAHLNELRRKHEHLSRTIEVEQRSPASDDLHVRDLKRQKLLLKEQISRLAVSSDV